MKNRIFASMALIWYRIGAPMVIVVLSAILMFSPLYAYIPSWAHGIIASIAMLTLMLRTLRCMLEPFSPHSTYHMLQYFARGEIEAERDNNGTFTVRSTDRKGDSEAIIGTGLTVKTAYVDYIWKLMQQEGEDAEEEKK